MLTFAAKLLRSWTLRLLAQRSPGWHKVEREHLRKQPFCQWCGGTADLQVHHKIPFHIDRSKELDPGNLITLCMAKYYECHYIHGHNGTSWMDWNEHIQEECDARHLRS